MSLSTYYYLEASLFAKMTSLSTGALFLDENIVNGLLTWPLVYWAVDQALRSVSAPSALLENSSTVGESYNGPISSQTPRTFTKLPNNSGEYTVT